MVRVFLRGGLGNQMFQYALGMNLAKRNSTGLVLDTVFLSDRFPRKNVTRRTLDLDIFLTDLRVTGLSEIAQALPIPGAWLGLDLMGMSIKEALHMQRTMYEKNEDFQASVLEEKGNIILFGKWQSEKYFSDIKDELRQAFRFRHILEGEAKALGSRVAATNSVSLHIRRGDYAAFKEVEAMMGKTDLSYYSRAASYIAERVEAPEFFVFSDDIAWCTANLKLPFPTTYVSDASAGPKSAFHLQLMSLCSHNIITNSTFSWWGAWLNQNPGKIVIAPKRWYADDTKSDRDIIPEGWVKI